MNLPAQHNYDDCGTFDCPACRASDSPAIPATPDHLPVAPQSQPDQHTCDTPNYIDGPCYACAKEKVLEWIFERYENCIRLAAQKTGNDKRGWLEDADHFMFVLTLLKRPSVPAPSVNREMLEALKSAMEVIRECLRCDTGEIGSYHAAREWLRNHNRYEGNLQELAVPLEVAEVALRIVEAIQHAEAIKEPK